MPLTPMVSERVEQYGAPLLAVRELRTHFLLEEGDVVAVNGATFDVYPGRTLGLVGESGCGKSIVARSILRLLDHPGRIVGGEMLWRYAARSGTPDRVVDLVELNPDGREIRKIRGGEISLIFQEPMASLSPVHTVGDQLIESLVVHLELSKADAHDMAVDLLRQVELPLPEQRMSAYSFQLSGGMRQRVMIAMALGCEPRLLIADEPTTALDVTTQAEILELLRTLQKAHGMAIIINTHDLGVVAQLADDVAVMYLGEVVERGPVAQIFHAPKHPYTRGLLEAIPRIDSESRRKRLPAIPGAVPHPYDRPSGCPFHPRCSEFIPGMCDVQRPAITRLGNHDVCCYLYQESH